MKNLVLIILLFFSFTISAQKLEPNDSMALIELKVTNFDNEPRKSEIIVLQGVKSKREFSGITDATGQTAFLIPKGDSYDIKYKNFGDEIDHSQLIIPDTNALVYSTLIIQIDPPKTYTLRNVHFDTGKSSLKQSSFPALNDLVEVLKLKPTMVIEIAGHTDSVASEDFNQKLSEERAITVRNYLISKGISPDRLTAKGYGESQPVATNATEEGRAKNRRTEVRIIKE
jgi:outer membrane protein OmpA-like peptidoglycan-associated protein